MQNKRMPQGGKACFHPDSAAAQGLLNCLVCHELVGDHEKRCPRCSTKLRARVNNSTQISFSLLLTALFLYIPANVYPIMITDMLGDRTQSTIIGGVILFLESESYFIAAVIFIASIIVPVGKMAAIAWLCYSVNRKKPIRKAELTQVYRITEFIGKWSMVDVFVVAILVALIQLGGLMSIQVGIAASAFAGVVILTMVSAHQFDTRILWDKMEDE
ncbi:paraquat-inducible protein A [Glaciecola sp. MH2013]|uniref:paraquat-inducible protein A n=1 Tax=Glaciecola sp. MH2013 TaxID=2785524 RepID=UPI00189F5DB8|nr:paraquat-inducible protein A [Glaciecola sp. MH2013]MBF7073908.1 paraquat-inducible protein A [Glaciecola sp. MH2013]